MENLEMRNEDEELLLITEELNNNQSLATYLRDNIYVIMKIIEKFPRTKKTKFSKKLENDIEISDTAYMTIAKVISKKFPEHSINSKNLGSMITRTKEKMGIKEPPKNKKFMTNHEKNNQYLQAVVSTPVAVTQQQPAKNERPQIQTEELSSVVVEESHLVSQVGDLSTGQVSQAQKMTLKEVYEKAINTDLGFKLEDSDDCKINIKDLLLEWIHPSVNYKKGRSINKVGDSLDKYREINEWEYKILKLILDYPIDDEGKKILIIGDHGLGKEKFQNTLINFYGLSFTPKERDDINDLIDRFTMVMKRTNKNFFNDIKELKYPNKK